MPSYDAFICYSRARDKPLAARLQSVIQTLGKPWYKRRSLRVFRDDTSLSATPQLWPSIEAALGQSRFLILLASSESATSKWVTKEVKYWLSNKEPNTLLIAVTDGELSWSTEAADFDWSATTPLPAVLKGHFASEPKCVDLSAYRDGALKADAKFTELGADFAAFIKGVAKEDLLSEELRQQRRALTLAWSMVALLLALGGLAAWQWRAAVDAERIAVVERTTAQEERDHAERALTLATQTANGLVFNLARKFRNMSGVPASLISDILSRARELQDQLTVGGAQSDDLQLSRAEALTEAVNSRLDMGEVKGALEDASQSISIFELLSASHPTNADFRRELSVGYEKLGDVQVAQGRLAVALESYRHSLAIRAALSTSNLGNVAWRRDLSVSYNKAGGVERAQGDFSAAVKSYRDSLAIDESLSASDPGNAEGRRELSMSYQGIGDVLKAQNDLPGALKSYRDSLAIIEALSASDPRNAGWRRDLSVSYDKVGDVQLAQSDLAAALKSYRDGLAIHEALSASDPGNASWRSDIFVSYVKLSVTEPSRAREHLQKAQAIAKELSDSGRLAPSASEWPGEINRRLEALDNPPAAP
jgi:tetratricopeptide (TPR) repeat protein